MEIQKIMRTLLSLKSIFKEETGIEITKQRKSKELSKKKQKNQNNLIHLLSILITIRERQGN